MEKEGKKKEEKEKTWKEEKKEFKTNNEWKWLN